MSTEWNLYKQDRSSNWFVRFVIGGHHIRKTTRTDDEKEANKRAAKIFFEYESRFRKGLNIKSITIGSILETYFSETKMKRSAYLFMTKYFVEYFSDYKPEQITKQKINDFFQWRKTYWLEGPGKNITHITSERNGRPFRYKMPDERRKPPCPSTIASETFAVKRFMKYLYENEFVEKTPVVSQTYNYEETQRNRTGLTEHELERFRTHITSNLETITQVFRKQTYVQFIAFVEFSLHTGCRPTEIMNIRWCDIEGYIPNSDTKQVISIQVKGKSKSRKMAAMPYVNKSLDILFNHKTEKPSSTDYIFTTLEGKQRHDMFPEYFNEALEQLGMKYDYRGVARTNYSLRHTVIMRLLTKGIDAYRIAKNLGTSVTVIERYYDSNSPDLYRDMWL